MFKLKIESNNLVYLAICAAGVLLFGLVGIYPNLSAMRQLDEDLVTLQKQIDDQALLNPLYRKLIEEVQLPLPADLPLTPTSKIDQGNLARLNETFAALAQANGLVLQSAVPDASSYREDGARLSVNVVFSGDFFDFRNLLMEICRLPFLNAIEHLRIETDQEKRRLILKMELLQ
jgi:Tfp pilus assembly protein PilO